jgi:glycosyltransferase involved in cell wall biosynthesis
LLSVLIPCYNYNVSLLLSKLQNQLNKQSFKFEIILNDDSSSDATIDNENRKTVEKIGASYIKNKKNLGRTATRQNLAKVAKYDKLLFMDVDVLPLNEDFIEKFDVENNTFQVIFGGINYSSEKPEKSKILRWTYGKAREARPLQERLKNPYLSIISQCFLIDKTLFLKANNFLSNRYGVDVLFCNNLDELNAKVKHIDNPILHLGLETSFTFIKKTEQGLIALHEFEKKGLLPNNYKKIQTTYITISRSGLLNIFMIIMKRVKGQILKNLISSKPSLLFFDLYRLQYFASLHKQEISND